MTQVTSPGVDAVPTGATKQRSYNGDYMARGKEGENIVLAWLERHPFVLEVEDFRDLRAVQKADIDFAICTKDGLITLAEVKSDSHLGRSGNVLFEVMRINHTAPPERACTLGWSVRSPAAQFLFYAPAVNSIYRCFAADLRAAFQAYTKAARASTRFRWINTDNIKSTYVALIPWREVEAIFKVYPLGGD